ncbi:MAG: hypothetical protein K8W52_28875 [Deltaproteobacteria bacterium]|nr:hypothetical protein [Deltaproteobacteria bacterium]
MTQHVALRPAIAAILDERRAAPALVFDLARIAETMARTAAAGRRHGVRVLFATKSFPAAPVLRLARDHLDGFDAANPGELALLGALARDRIVSITDPAVGALDGAALAACDPWISCEDADRAAAAPAASRIAIRIAASHLVPGDDAVGGVALGDGSRTSRFGVRPGELGAREALGAILRAGGNRVRGLHIHHGGVAMAAPARLLATAAAALRLADEHRLPLSWLNLGGGLHLLGDRLDETFAALRALVPPSIELAVEPGRLFASGAGFAVGRVRAARELAEVSLRVVDLSRACHLKWQQPSVIARPAKTGEARRVLFTGPTCYEDDLIGEWKLAPSNYPVGAALALTNVNGYAVGWNTGFGGVAPAEVVWVE